MGEYIINSISAVIVDPSNMKIIAGDPLNAPECVKNRLFDSSVIYYIIDRYTGVYKEIDELGYFIYNDLKKYIEE